MAKFNFNSATVEPMQARSFDPLPKGDYEMMIVKSDVKPTQARIWERLNVDNPNKTAQDISQGLLASLCFAVGVKEIGETEELHDTPFIAHVEIDKKDPTRNRIMGYATAGMAPAMATKAPAPAPTPAPAAATKRPWG